MTFVRQHGDLRQLAGRIVHADLKASVRTLAAEKAGQNCEQVALGDDASRLVASVFDDRQGADLVVEHQPGSDFDRGLGGDADDVGAHHVADGSAFRISRDIAVRDDANQLVS